MAHSHLRWLVLLGLVISAAAGFARARADAPWRPASRRLYVAAAVLFDVQAALGILLYLGDRGWAEGVHIAVVHPIGMLAALGLLHATVARARRQADSGSHRLAGAGALGALMLALLVIPWWR